MVERSIFQDEWRKCLREHYKYVIREQDRVTEASLTKVLYRLGFSDDELRQLYTEATMRQEANPADFVPDMSKAVQAHPAECTCDLCSADGEAAFDAMLEAGHDEAGQPLPPEEPVAEATPEVAGNLFAMPELEAAESAADDDEIVSDGDEDDDDSQADDDAPRQMSMF